MINEPTTIKLASTNSNKSQGEDLTRELEDIGCCSPENLECKGQQRPGSPEAPNNST